MAVVGAALAVMVAAVLEAHGWRGEAALRAVVRATARSSLALFLGAYLASTLARRWPGPVTRWLLEHRRGIGLSFALSHLGHGVALVLLARTAPAFSGSVSPVTRLAGGIGFVVVAALAATSNDRAVRALGPRRWARLHRAGVHYLWAVFFVTYLGTSRVLAAVVAAALTLRLALR